VSNFNPQSLSPEDQSQFAALSPQLKQEKLFQLFHHQHMQMQMQMTFKQLTPLQVQQLHTLQLQQQQQILQQGADKFDHFYQIFEAQNAKQREELAKRQEDLARRQDEERKTSLVHSRYSYATAESDKKRKKPPLQIPLVNRAKLEERMREACM
jgi:hypothetical protein